VIGNSIATSVVAKWEGQLGEPLTEAQLKAKGVEGAAA